MDLNDLFWGKKYTDLQVILGALISGTVIFTIIFILAFFVL